MTRQSFEHALSATARVACAAALVGCVKATPKPAAESAAGAVAATEAAAPPSEAQDPELATCAEAVEALREDGVEGQAPECCEAVVTDAIAAMESPELSSLCCGLVGWDVHFPGCTPWGPPRPPSMGARLSAAHKVRAVRAAARQGVV